MLRVRAAPIAADPSDTHNLAWSFDSTPQAFDYLATGETLTLTYTVRSTDGTASDAQTVTVTVTGTNDAPDIHLVTTDTASAGLTETNAALTAGGTLTVNDPDVSDTVTSSVFSVAASGTTPGLASPPAALFSILSVPAGPIAAAPSFFFKCSGAFRAPPPFPTRRPSGLTLTLTYTVRSTDGTASDAQTV